MADEIKQSTRDKIEQAITQIVLDEEQGYVGKWVAVIDLIGRDGDRQLWSLHSKDLAMWDQIGMLQFRRDMLQPEAPLYYDEDDEDREGSDG